MYGIMKGSFNRRATMANSQWSQWGQWSMFRFKFDKYFYIFQALLDFIGR